MLPFHLCFVGLHPMWRKTQPQRAKPGLALLLTARLKSCPDALPLRRSRRQTLCCRLRYSLAETALRENLVHRGERIFLSIRDLRRQCRQAELHRRYRPELSAATAIPQVRSGAASSAPHACGGARRWTRNGREISRSSRPAHRCPCSRSPPCAPPADANRPCGITSDSIACSSCSRRSAPSRSDLFNTKMSPISIRPAFMF